MDTRTPPVCSRRAARPMSLLVRLVRHVFEAAALTAVLIVLSGTGRAWAVEPWPEIPLPPKADVQWVAQSMRVNGVPTRVMQFQSRSSRAQIVDYYRAYWTGAYPHKASVQPLGDATVVGQMHGPYLMNVKVQDAARGGSHGLISVARVLGSKADRDPGELPLIGGAQVISVVESDDPGKHSRELLIRAPQPPSSVAQFYEASLGNVGWRQLQGNDTPANPGGPTGRFMAFGRDGKEMQLSIVATPRVRGSVIVANLVTKDTGTDRD